MPFCVGEWPVNVDAFVGRKEERIESKSKATIGKGLNGRCPKKELASMNPPIISRRGKAVSCKFCGETGLEWIALSGSARTPSDWHLIPFGESDATNIHTCKSRNTAPAVTGQSPVVDLTPVLARIDGLDTRLLAVETVATQPTVIPDTARIDAIESELDGVKPLVVAISDRIDVDLVAMKARIDDLDKARPIVVSGPSLAKPVNIGRQHAQFANLLTMVQAIRGTGVVYVVGEGGSFKTSAIPHLAKALGVDYTIRSVGRLTSETDLLGWHDANGRYVESHEYVRYTQGGIMAWDEFDNISAEGAVSVNGMTSNGTAGFPNGMATRHPDTHFVAMGNTFGRGADAQYVGRSQLDAATLNRFCYLPWDTDWQLLGDLYGLEIPGDAPSYPAPGKPRTIDEIADWGQYVKRIHDIVVELRIRALVSSRAVINGRAMLLAGIDRNLVEYSVIWAHMSDQDAATVRARL